MTTQVKASCLCGNVQEEVVLDTGPHIHSVICHCNVCRHSTGNLFYSTLPLLTPPKIIDTLTKYSASEKKSRYFCRTCGTHLYIEDYSGDTWFVASGVIDRVLEDEQVSSCRSQRVAEHQFVADTVDGGLAVCLTKPSKVSTRFYLHDNGGLAIDPTSPGTFPQLETECDVAVDLHAACNCGGVEIFLSRPNEKSRDCSSPWPDLLRPYHSHDPANPDDAKWWIRGSSKYLAGTCGCRSCRLGNGSPITSWVFVPKANLSTRAGLPFDFNISALQSYASSEGRTRYFCRICGASIILRIDERPELLDVCLGLFRATEGSRAEHWFDWCTDRVSFAEEALDKDMIATCELGLKHLNVNAS